MFILVFYYCLFGKEKLFVFNFKNFPIKHF